jgi:hypothetical protein
MKIHCRCIKRAGIVSPAYAIDCTHGAWRSHHGCKLRIFKRKWRDLN